MEQDFSNILGKRSHLSFWHGDPEINLMLDIASLGPYYMLFKNKANYNGDIDSNGILMLNYHGKIGLQYNPIAIAQWGLEIIIYGFLNNLLVILISLLIVLIG